MNGELLRFQYNQKYLIADCETEGLSLVNSRPWQIAWMIATKDKVIKENNRFIFFEDLNISDEAARITGFDKYFFEAEGRLKKQYRIFGETVSAEPAKDVWRDFAQDLYNEDFLIIGQNFLGFDVYMINVLRKLLNLKTDYSFIDRIIDTRALATAIFKNIKVDKDNLLAWQYKLINLKEKGLKTSNITLLKHYSIPHDPEKLHDGEYDVQMTFEIFKKQIFDIEI